MGNCINRKHPEIIKMAEELNVLPAVLSAKIGLWQTKNDIIDRFPTVEELANNFDNISEELENKIKNTSISDELKVFIYNQVLNNPLVTNEKGDIIRPYEKDKFISIERYEGLVSRVFSHLAYGEENNWKDKFIMLEILKEVFPNLSENQIKKTANLAFAFEEAKFDAMEEGWLEQEFSGFRLTSSDVLSWEQRIQEYDLQKYLNRAPFKIFESKNNILFNKKDLNEFVDNDLENSIFSRGNISQDSVNENKLFEENKELLFGKESTDKSFQAKTVLQNIIDTELELSNNAVELVTKAINVLNKANARVKVISQEKFDKMVVNSQGEGTAVMAYEPELSVIYLTESTLQNFNKDVIIESFLHEVAHNLSIKAIVNPVTHEEIQFKELISKAFEQYKYLGDLKDSKSYGFTNEKEFVAELYSNSSFRNEISELDKGFWRKFKDAVRRLFGLPKSLQNDELINSILLIESVEKFIETNESNFNGLARNNYNNAFNSVLFKKVEQPKEIELDTLEKKLSYTIGRSLDKIDALIKRTKSNKNVKNKKDHESFIKSFEELFKEIETLETTNKWQAITAYTKSFSKTVFNLNTQLKNLLYDSETGTFTKNISTEQMLETSYKYDEYLAAYDLLDEINSLISSSENDEFITKDEQLEINNIKDILSDLQKDHNSLKASILNVKKAYATKMFSDPNLNTEIVTKWRNKLFQEHKDLKIQGETKEAYFGRMIEGKYKKEYQADLLKNAKKIVNDPTFDLESITKSTTDILNTNTPILNIMSNVIGKLRENIISTYRDKNFEISKLFDKYSKEKGHNKQSEMYKNLIQLSKNDKYYLRGEYSTDFIDKFEQELQPITKEIYELVEGFKAEGRTKAEIKKHSKYKELVAKRSKWYKENTIKIDKETFPHPRFKNKELTGIEKETVDYFISETEKNNDSYNNTASLVTNLFGAKFYKLPSVTKSDLERTLEGDLKGQISDKYKDLTQIRVDDVGFAEAINNKNEELRTVKIHYRGNLSSKDQSLDLFTVYRKEALNAINYSNKKAMEPKLKLFIDIVSSKKYKKVSSWTGKWSQNKFAKNQPGVIFEGEFSNELQRVKGLLETHVYDVLSYNGGKVFGSNVEVNKVSSMVNGFAASIAMTANLGSGTVNVLNGVTQMFIESVGGKTFSKNDLLKAEANYSKNIMNILADLNEPIKKSFHNQLLEMFDAFGGFDLATQEFLRNSYSKKLLSRRQMNMLNEMGEHMMNSILTETMLRGIKTMNVKREFIDKNGNVVEESKAASLFDMLSIDKDGKLTMSEKVVYTNKNLDSKYHEGGKSHINYLIKKKGHDIFGVYDPLMKAEIAKHWWGKTLMMFKNFFLSGFKYRYQSFNKSLIKKEDLTDDDLVFNNAEQEFTEGIYTTFARFITKVVFPALKGLQLSYISENYNQLSDYEKSNLKKTTLEISLTMVILPLLGYLFASLGGDDDEKPYFALYVFRRLESELSQFRNPIELNRMIQNPVAANRFIQNLFTAASEIATPLNFNPGNNEYFFDYLSTDSKDNNKVLKSIKKITPFYAQFNKPYREMHNLINK